MDKLPYALHFTHKTLAAFQREAGEDKNDVEALTCGLYWATRTHHPEVTRKELENLDLPIMDVAKQLERAVNIAMYGESEPPEELPEVSEEAPLAPGKPSDEPA